MSDIVIVGAKRTAIGSLLGQFTGVPTPTLGGNGYINEYPTGRILRDAKLYAIGAGTNEIRKMLIGRELFDGRS